MNLPTPDLTDPAVVVKPVPGLLKQMMQASGFKLHFLKSAKLLKWESRDDMTMTSGLQSLKCPTALMVYILPHKAR